MEIRPYREGDEQQILKLFKLSFGKEMTIEYWNWRFANNPFSNDKQIHLMWEGDLLVGHYAVSPTEFCIENEKVMGALSMTTMTHPEFAGKGIFSALAESLYAQLRKSDYGFVWGFPNPNSHYGFIKNLAWKDLGILPMLSLHVSALQSLNDVEYKLRTDFDDPMLLMLQDPSSIALNKTKSYLNWRYTDNPFAHYKIIYTASGSIVVYKKIVSFQDSSKFEIDILEINFSSDVQQLIRLLNAILKEEHHIIKFNVWCSLYRKEYLQMDKAGFKMTLPLTYLGFRSFDSAFDVMEDLRRWNLSMGYSDVF